jgi:hypothetical protein
MAESGANHIDAGFQKAIARLETMLVPGETQQATAIQRRLFALLHRRILVSATSGRLIGIDRGLFGGFSPTDLRWQDIKSAHIQERIFGSNLTVTALTQPDLASGGTVRTFVFNGLRKDEATAVYRICQAQEQAWREKRRLRELEEMRAKSGGFTGNFGSGAAGIPSEGDSLTRLQKAKAMLDQGLISDSEFETIKARIVGQI